MGARPPARHVMAWQSDLAGMKAAGTRVRASCQRAACGHWWDVDLDEMIALLVSDRATLWDRSLPCEQASCSGAAMFLASPGPSTPFRPLVSADVPQGGLPPEAWMDGWFGLDATPCPSPLQSLGVGWRDWMRIRDLALATDVGNMPAAIPDLNVPYRIGACMPGWETRFSGDVVGEYAGRILLAWPRPANWGPPRH